MNTTKPSAGAYVDGLRQQLTEVKEAHRAALERCRAEYARRVKAENGLAELLEAARDAQCDCSPKERDSGHKSECWFPALQAAIEKGTV